MEIDEHHKDFFSKSEFRRIRHGCWFGTSRHNWGIEKAFDHILEMRKRYLKALEKYDEIEDKKYVKLKRKIWAEWYDVNEDGEEESEVEGENEEDNDGDDLMWDKSGQ